MVATRTFSPSPRSLTIRPHTGQLASQQATQPFVADIAGTGGGKTVNGMACQITNMIRNPEEISLVAEPTWAMVNRILMQSTPQRPSLLRLIQHIDPGAFYSKADHIIYSRIGTVLLASARNPESMEGAHVAWAWLDEAGLMSSLAFETATRRVAFKGGQVRLTTTPYNRGWLYRDFYQRFLSGDPNYFVIKYSSLANPTYSRAAYERNRITMSRARFNMMHEGAFERAEGMVYADQWNDDLVIKPFAIPDSWWQAAAIDLGFNHPTAATWAARDDDGTYYITQDYRKPTLLLHQHAKNLLALSSNGIRPSRWWADPAAKQARADLAGMGIITSPAKNEVGPGIDTVASLMAQGRLKVFNTCAAFLDEVESYVWDKANDIWLDKPVKRYDDVMDALRYLLHSAEHESGLALYT
jgi:hypothetical protein